MVSVIILHFHKVVVIIALSVRSAVPDKHILRSILLGATIFQIINDGIADFFCKRQFKCAFCLCLYKPDSAFFP